ncbi:MAG TPA: AAA family ATPase [Anaerolineae bacterium]|nr:AAA family ATPase [Anaerolineae bacterium]
MNLVLLYGPPAVGKMTVGAQLSQLTGYPLFHNHLTVDLGLLFFPFGSAPFQRLVTGLRYQCVQAAAEAGAQGLIFTYVYGGGDDEQVFVDELSAIVEDDHGGRLLPVRLFCRPATLLARVAEPSRADHHKLRRPEELAALLAARDLLQPLPGRESLALDTDRLTPQEAALAIAQNLGLPRREDGA